MGYIYIMYVGTPSGIPLRYPISNNRWTKKRNIIEEINVPSIHPVFLQWKPLSYFMRMLQFNLNSVYPC